MAATNTALLTIGLPTKLEEVDESCQLVTVDHVTSCAAGHSDAHDSVATAVRGHKSETAAAHRRQTVTCRALDRTRGLLGVAQPTQPHQKHRQMDSHVHGRLSSRDFVRTVGCRHQLECHPWFLQSGDARGASADVAVPLRRKCKTSPLPARMRAVRSSSPVPVNESLKTDFCCASTLMASRIDHAPRMIRTEVATTARYR